MRKEENLTLVYPYGLWRNYYVPFYDEFLINYIFKINKNSILNIIVKDKTGKLLVEEKFKGNISGINFCR